MNPIWAFFFKDKFRTIFSIYKMSLAELLVLLSMTVGSGVGIYLLGEKALNLMTDAEVVEE